MNDNEKFAPPEPDRPQDEVDASETTPTTPPVVRDDVDSAAAEASAAVDEAVEAKVMERLREADPAADVEPSPQFPAVVAERASRPAGDGDPAADTDGADTDDDGVAAEGAPPAPVDLAARRTRRRWFTPAAAAAAAAIVGVSGYAVGAGAAGGGVSDSAESAESAAAPIQLGGPQQAGGAEVAASDTAEATSMDPLAKYSARGAVADSMWGGPGRSSFTASGLSTAERSATAYGLDAVSASTAERLTQVAAALGMSGTPELKDGAWMLSADGKELFASLDAQLGLYFYDQTRSPWCEGCAEPRPEDAPSGDEAIAALKDLLVAIGEDPTQFEYTAPTWEGAVTGMAAANRVVDGQSTDLAFNLELTKDGVSSFSGPLAGVVDLGTYPVVSEQEAFERLSDSRFGGYRTSWPENPVVMAAEASEDPTQWVPPTEPPPAPEAGARLAWGVEDVEIVSARLGLGQQWQPDGTVVLAPSYEFTDADGGTWSVIAVADDLLDFTTE